MESFCDPNYFTQEDLQNFFIIFFSLPMTTYLVAWGYQTVRNLSSRRYHHCSSPNSNRGNQDVAWRSKVGIQQSYRLVPLVILYTS